MANERILAVGKVVKGDLHLQIAPRGDSLVPSVPFGTSLAAIDFGRRLYEAGASRSACVNEYEGIGYDEAEHEATTVLAPLQDMIDYAAELQELLDAREDDMWHARGGW
jgi:hypothetical protein